MRLLRIEADGAFSLGEYVGRDIPRYAILSHTWGADHEEVTFRDFVEGAGKSKAGYRKLTFCGKQAANDGLRFFWVDTCCIDKASSAELSEAINSMFRWYQHADKCYVYLSDVSTSGFARNDQSFQKSRWFTRGWTLQELIGPICVEFFSSEGDQIGDKSSMVKEIHNITRIPIQALQGTPLAHFSIDERMSWTEKRETKREEDTVYCLLGIFDIHMPLLYGEGRKRAFSRLQRELKESSESYLHALSSPALYTEQPKRKWGPISTVPSGEDPDFVERSDIPGILSAYIDAMENTEVYKDFGVDSYHTTPDFEGNKPRPKVRANVVGISDGKRREMHDPQLEGQDLEAVLKGVLGYALDTVDADERTRLQSRNDSEAYDEAFANIPGLPSEKTKNENKAPLPASMRDEFRGASRRGGKFANQVEMFQNATNTLSNLVLPTNRASHSLQQSTKLEEYIKNEQIQDRIGYTSVQEIFQLLVNIKRRARLESQNTVNDWLDVTKFNNQYNVAQYYDKQVSSRLEGTCEWFFSHPAYRAWISEEHLDKATRILWICAPAGHGKTVLCAKLVEHLKGMQSFPVVYFFASPHAQSGGEPSLILRSWIAQIAQLDSNVLELVRRHSEAGQRASESAIWSLFGSVVSENSSYAFILDGFDEYSRLEDARTEFLQKLKEATKRTFSRILITSRDETDIRVELSPMVVQHAGHVMLQCRISNEDLRHDITHFSRSVVDKKLPNKDDHLRQDLAGQLAEKCEGMFLWIKLQQDQLRGGKNAKQLQNIVKNMPIGLEKTYERNWKIIQSHPLKEQNRALAILRWTTFALRPLTVSEITEALIVEPDDGGTTLQLDELPDNVDDEYINSEIIDICGALVEVRTENFRDGDGTGSKTIHLIHSSVREFLLSNLANTSDHYLESDQTPGQAEQHERLATICLGYLNCDDVWQRCTTQEISGLGRSFNHYAARHWNSHITAAGKDNAKLVNLVTDFFRPENKNFDHWRRYVESSDATADGIQEKNRVIATPLYYAALFDLPTIMEHIWAEDPAQLDRVGGEYGIPLQAACFKGHELAFSLLIGWGANPNVEGGKFGIPINAAIAGGRRSMVKDLLGIGVNCSLQDSMGRTPLYTAAMNGDSEIVRWLIEAGAEQALTNKYGWTPLNVAASNGHLEVVKLLLEKDADTTVPNNNGWTPLHTAVSKGHLEVVKLLLKKGADTTIPNNNNGWTPLNAAASNDHLEVVKLLLEKGADTTVPSKDGWTPLNAAASNGHLEVVKLLLEKDADTTVPNNNGWTPLNAAANNSHLEVVKLLLEKDADTTVPNNDGWTPLNVAASNGHLEVVKLLLEKNADTTVPSNNGWTPLNVAASNGHLEVVKLLLEKNADTTVPSNYGWTPLNVAASNGHLEVVKLLLEKDADTTVPDKDGQTPLYAAASNGHLEVVKLLLEKDADTTVPENDGWTPLYAAASNDHLKVIKLLLEKDADTTVPDKDGWTPLYAAASNGHLEVVKLLLEKDADTTVPNNDGWTPLNAAVCYSHLEVVKLLLEKGADTTVPDNDGWTPLHTAASKGHVEVVKLLLEKGADTIVPSNDGWTPLHTAASNGHVEVVKLLLKNDADFTTPNNNGWTPLNAAADNGHLEVVKLLLAIGSDVNSLDNYHGSFPNLLAFRGYTDLLRLTYEQYHANLHLTEPHSRTPLQVAARGGCLDTFLYLISRGFDPTAEDAKGDGLLCYASSGGSLQVLNAVLSMGSMLLLHSRHWSPLHWACRAGNPEVVERLIEEGLRSECVTVPQPEGQWSPISIAIFHGNEEMLGKLSASCRSLLTAEAGTVRFHGEPHGFYSCNGCFHDIYGPRFHCRTCLDLDYCFMCKPFLDNLHTNHGWDYFESHL